MCIGFKVTDSHKLHQGYSSVTPKLKSNAKSKTHSLFPLHFKFPLAEGIVQLPISKTKQIANEACRAKIPSVLQG